jgi:uncharacterized protein
MSQKINRRGFLKAVPVAGAAACSSLSTHADGQTSIPGSVRIGTASYTPVRDYPWRPKRGNEVRVKDRFWAPKIRTNAEVTIPFQVQKRAQDDREFSLNVLEAAITSLQTHPNSVLAAQVEKRIRSLAAQPWRGNTNFEIAAAYFNATGNRELLDQASKTAEALYENFKINNPPFSGGERDALNCLQLYRATGGKKHLDLAKHYLDIRGLENSVNRSRHNQSYKPVLEQSEAVGHAVNCATLMVSLADVGVLTGLRDYFNAAQRMWADAVERKMYITGGVGSTGNEGFGAPYSLPNISAYAETCAVLMFITLNHRLFLATGDSKYIDVMERGMYNNALSGFAAAGNRFFYVNRLASAGDGRDTRWERASLECCPPNLVRFLAAVPGFVYAQDKQDAVYVNLYLSSEASFNVAGKDLMLAVESEMPWGGKSKITVSAKQAVRGTIKLRIPGWARNQVAPGTLYSYQHKLDKQPMVSVNGKAVSTAVDRTGYVSLERMWQNGDRIEIEFPFEARQVVTDSRVRENRGRVAIECGPIVYCAEWPEVTDGRALDLMLDTASELKAAFDESLLGGVTVIAAQARRMTNPSLPPQPIKLIPYYLWANRGAGEMSVWLPVREYELGDVGPAGGFIFYKNPNAAADGWRYLEAAPVDQSAGAKWGCFRRVLTGARGTVVGTGKKNTEEMLAACAERGTAADLCANYSLNGVGGWFLPSRDELALMYRHLKATGVADFRDDGLTDNCSYWTSSQVTADMAHHLDFPDAGRDHYDDKDFPRRVRASRAF